MGRSVTWGSASLIAKFRSQRGACWGLGRETWEIGRKEEKRGRGFVTLTASLLSGWRVVRLIGEFGAGKSGFWLETLEVC